ncbi:MAG: FGGY family carbohydrate kinase, partial [Bacilli bacterium]
MEEYILTIDQGTTSSRAILFNKKGQMAYMSQREVTNFFPKPSWVEQDALEIWVSVGDVINELKIKLHVEPTQIKAIGIT